MKNKYLILTGLLFVSVVNAKEASQKTLWKGFKEAMYNAVIKKNLRSTFRDAVYGNDIDSMEMCVAKGINVDIKDGDGRTGLFVGSFESGISITTMQWLIDHGADVNARDKNKMTPIFYAAILGKIDKVKWLIAHGADIDARDRNGCTCFMLACGEGHLETMQWLIAHGADINARDKNDMTGIMHAAEEKKYLAVAWLIDHKAEIKVGDAEGLFTC